MTSAAIFVIIMVIGMIGFAVARQKIIVEVDGNTRDLNSLPRHYGYYASACAIIPGLMVLIFWLSFGTTILEQLIVASLPADFKLQYEKEITLLLNRIRLIVDNSIHHEGNSEIIAAAEKFKQLYSFGIWATFFLTLAVSLAGVLFALSRTKPSFRARSQFERIMLAGLMASSIVAVITTVGIVASLLFESVRFFSDVSILDFAFGLEWSPQTALRDDQIGASGSFGAIPLFAGTLLVTLVAMLVAGPIGLMSAIYLTQYASPMMRTVAKPLLEILAGVPTVVYGFFAALTISPIFQSAGEFFSIDIASESALAAGFVMGIMIIPFVSSLTDDAIIAVPQSIQDGSTALGATRTETILKVIIPAALPGIVGAFLLAISRAVGETMIVVMAAGLQPNLTANPFEAVTTVTVQIVSLLTGDQEFDSTKTLSAFALGLALFSTTLVFNALALRLVRRYRQVYE
jgi:phosphate transport system permease protein